jgi:K+-sensing histidine kinase KdpD
MNTPPADAELSRLLSLAAHELRNPLSIVVGYIGFVTRDKRIDVAEQHRKWLEIAVNSCNRLREVIDQLSEYSKLQSGEIQFTRKPIDLGALLAQAVDALPPMIEREVPVDILKESGDIVIQADEAWAKRALISILIGLRLEVGASNRLLVVRRAGEYKGEPAAWILIGDADQVETLRRLNEDALGWFDDKNRGNLGLTVWIAKRVLEAHGGGLWAPPAMPKGGGAVIVLPHS